MLKPLRHVEALADLSREETANFGPLIQRITAAVRAVLQPAKVYLCQFSEAEGFAHIHFHLIPRTRDLPTELRGAAVFDLLSTSRREGRDIASPQEAERIAREVREQLQFS